MILNRLMWPLAGALALLFALAVGLLWHQQEKRLTEEVNQRVSEIPKLLDFAKTQRMAVMNVLLDAIIADAELREALKAGDSERLLALSHETFEYVRREHAIQNFYFRDRDRVTLLRVHAPETRGGRSEKFTTLEAERTGRSVGGVELGYFGLFMLRVVKPVYSDGELIGFVEFSQNIDSLLQRIHVPGTIELAVSIHKRFLDRDTWEAGFKMAGRDPDWDRFPDDVISYSSMNPLPKEFLELHLQDYNVHDHDRIYHGWANGRLWRVAFIPIRDASGRDIGDLHVMLDITATQEDFRRAMIGAGIMAVGMLTLLMLFLYTLLRRTDRRILAQQRDLYRAKLLRELAAHHEKIREGERTNIAREVHDQLGQCLTGLRLEANLIKRRLGPEPPELREHATSMIEIIDTTLEAVRNITAALRPAVLDMGLAPATEWLLSDTARRAGLEHHFDADDIEECALTDEQTTALFRTLQEALTNILRHARAKAVHVTIERQNDDLTMRIEDDGVGFDVEAAERNEGKSFGLMGMRERATMIGGELQIDSRPGRGTVISVRIPCGEAGG